MVFLVFLMLSSLKNTKLSKKHNRHLGNERYGSIRLFGIMSNKRLGNVLISRFAEQSDFFLPDSFVSFKNVFSNKYNFIDF